jgi:hypothetical protein
MGLLMFAASLKLRPTLTRNLRLARHMSEQTQANFGPVETSIRTKVSKYILDFGGREETVISSLNLYL